MRGVPLGSHQIIASIIGYQQQWISLRVTDTTQYVLTFRLKTQNVQMAPVEIKGTDPVEWKEQLLQFKSMFFGSTSNAAQSSLLNPEVLDFSYDEKRDEFTATACAPLIIINRALGYRLRYHLKYFKKTSVLSQFYGVAQFEPLPHENADEMIHWKLNRRETYKGSRRHFFAALFQKNLEQEGFTITSITKPRRQISATDRIGANLDPESVVSEGVSIHEKRFSFQGVVQVIYGGLLSGRASSIELTQNAVTFFRNGEVADPLELVIDGFWATQRVAEFLPNDYEP